MPTKMYFKACQCSKLLCAHFTYMTFLSCMCSPVRFYFRDGKEITRTFSAHEGSLSGVHSGVTNHLFLSPETAVRKHRTRMAFRPYGAVGEFASCLPSELHAAHVARVLLLSRVEPWCRSRLGVRNDAPHSLHLCAFSEVWTAM